MRFPVVDLGHFHGTEKISCVVNVTFSFVSSHYCSIFKAKQFWANHKTQDLKLHAAFVLHLDSCVGSSHTGRQVCLDNVFGRKCLAFD